MFRYFARLYEKYGLPIYPIALFSYDLPQVQIQLFQRVKFPDFVVLEFNYRVLLGVLVFVLFAVVGNAIAN